MTKDQLIAMARQAAEAHGIDPALVCAVVHHESNWQTWAVRYEPFFFERYVKSMNYPQTELQNRATSFGLLQVMGQVAREFGFDGNYLTELCDPLQGLEYGCKKLARCLRQANGDVRDALLAYNGGGNLQYPDLVLQYIDRYRN